jgi:lysophospholipase L1-like esterase
LEGVYVTVVCIGDSLTYGYGVPASYCWVNLIQKNSTCHFINKGVNGASTTSLLCRSHRDILALQPDYVIIMAGTNDFLMGSSVNHVFDNISLLCKEACDYGIRPIIMVPPSIDEAIAKERWASEIDYKAVNTKIELLALQTEEFSLKMSIYFINLYKTFDSLSTDYDDLYIDGIHLNIKGHALIYEELLTLDIFNK